MKVSKKVKEPQNGSESEDMDASIGNSKIKWNCSICTLENSGKSKRCEACDFPRPTSTRMPRISSAHITKVAREQELIKQKTTKKKQKQLKTSDRMSNLKDELENTNSNSSVISNSSAHSDNGELSSSSINASPSASSSKKLEITAEKPKKKRGRQPKMKSSTITDETPSQLDDRVMSDDESSTTTTTTTTNTTLTTNAASRLNSVPILSKPKMKRKKKPGYFESLVDYNDFRTHEVTCHNVTVVITEFRRKDIEKTNDKSETNNNGLTQNLNFLNQIPKFQSK